VGCPNGKSGHPWPPSTTLCRSARHLPDPEATSARVQKCVCATSSSAPAHAATLLSPIRQPLAQWTPQWRLRGERGAQARHCHLAGELKRDDAPHGTKHRTTEDFSIGPEKRHGRRRSSGHCRRRNTCISGWQGRWRRYDACEYGDLHMQTLTLGGRLSRRAFVGTMAGLGTSVGSLALLSGCGLMSAQPRRVSRSCGRRRVMRPLTESAMHS
jgi:hypothetical protein